MVYGQGLNSDDLNKIMKEAQKIAKEKGSYTIDGVHLLLALIKLGTPKTTKCLRRHKKQIEETIDAYLSAQPSAAPHITPTPNVQKLESILTNANAQASKENTTIQEIHILHALLKSPEIREILSEVDLAEITEKIESKEEDKQTIDDFAVDMVEQAKEGVFDPVIGRNKEIRAVLEVLTKKIKSNAMLLGEPGVGKTAIVNGLAQLIANNQAPGLTGCRLYSVDLGALVAGTMYHGQFEERLKTLIKETEESNRTIILFIDEIHMILGAGKTQGAMNAANLLKPGLASGSIRCIGATTYTEYKQYIEKDPAFERRFVTVNVAEPTVDDTITILRGLRERFESYHGLSILNETLECAAEMGSRYLTGGHMPDTAITLLDAACASVKISLESEPAEIMALKSKIWAVELEKAAIQSDETRDTKVNNEERLNKVDNKLNELISKLTPMEQEYNERMEHIIKRKRLKTKIEALKVKLANAERDRNTQRAHDIKNYAIPDTEKELELLGSTDERICIRPEHIAEMVSNITGIPAKRLTLSENQRLLQIEDRLNARVVGQSQPIRTVANSIIRSKAGFSRPNRPIGSFLLLGPTGVGKTQLAKSLAYELFDDEQALVRIDMSEYLEEHSVSRLIGAPPGYVGHESGGYLTEKIRNRPYSIILIDEIEKAHKRVANLFLQVLDDGRLTDGQGRTVNFANTVILMTSNLGSNEIITDKRDKENVISAVKRFFPPEFINRLDGVEIFNSLEQADLEAIVNVYVKEINQRMQKNKIEVELLPSAVAQIIEQAYTPEYGARPLQRYIEQTITTDISKIYLGLTTSSKVSLLITALSDITGPKRSKDTPFYTGESFKYYIK